MEKVTTQLINWHLTIFFFLHKLYITLKVNCISHRGLFVFDHYHRPIVRPLVLLLAAFLRTCQVWSRSDEWLSNGRTDRDILSSLSQESLIVPAVIQSTHSRAYLNMTYMLYKGPEWKPVWALWQHTNMHTGQSANLYLNKLMHAHFEETVFSDEYSRQTWIQWDQLQSSLTHIQMEATCNYTFTRDRLSNLFKPARPTSGSIITNSCCVSGHRLNPL